MIQELLLSDRKISHPFSSTSPLLSTTNNNNTSIATTPPCTTTVVNLSSTTSGGAGAGAGTGVGNSENNGNNNNQNLRCPRCDSTNTKFCYYNNYNLTQPRHFCKTCRRYWTKGGTLRNVPIGGGCRKNKSGGISSNNNSSISSSSIMSSKSSTSSNFLAKIKANTLTSEMLVNDNNSLFLGHGFSDPGPGPLPWSSSPSSLPQAQNSHILALLRGSSPFSNPNPSNPNPNPNVFTSLGLDSYGNGTPSLLGSFTRNPNNQHHLLGFPPNLMDNNNNNNENNSNSNSNIMDLYQRLKSSTTTNYGYSPSNNENNHGSLILGHMVGTPTPSSSINTSSIYETVSTTPFGGGGDHLGGYGLMNSNHGISSWNDFPALPINGTYP